MRPLLLVLPVVLVLSGCNVGNDDGANHGTKESTSRPAAAPSAAPDALAAHDNVKSAQDIPDSEPRPIMQAQVVLDRLGFTPGVVDGEEGMSTRNAVSGYQEANKLAVTGKLDPATIAALAQYQAIPATRVVTIPDDFAAGPFVRIPKRPEDQASLAALGYESLDEKLAERFHTTVATLKLLNPDGRPAGAPPAAPAEAAPKPMASPADPDAPPVPYFHAGQQIRVPNVGADAIQPGSVTDKDWLATLAMLGVSSEQPRVADIVVSKSKGTLKAYDDAGKLVAVYTATMGSQHDPLPLGDWGINGVSHNPKFHYNPALFWDAKAGSEKATLPPGPNGPVGVVWIDLTKPHYGIHGTPNPETIGRAESHGCVRLTNWDAARLAQMVSVKTKVHFEA
ncbi:MAG: L,D-transpeptidase [Novosphingobium sp.]